MSRALRLAVWLIRHLYAGDGEALTGDLLEQMADGRTAVWFWKQALLGIAIGTLRHWPEFVYAAAATVAPFVIPSLRLPDSLPWWNLPWPFSQVLLDLGPAAFVSLAPLTVLGLALLRRGRFRWSRLFVTEAIGLAFLPVVPLAIMAFPALLRPMPGNPYAKALVIPPLAQLTFLFMRSLFAAWVGCREARPQTVPGRTR